MLSHFSLDFSEKWPAKFFRIYPLARRSYENDANTPLDQQIPCTFIFKTMETHLKNPLEVFSFKIEREQAA